MIQVWTINILVMISRGRTEKSKNGQKHHRTKAPKDQNQGGQNPPKWENILRLQQSRCTIPWSHDTGMDNQHSRHAITWPHREKQKSTKAPQDESPKGSESRRTKPPKMRKYFKTPTNKVYDPMITWYRCGQSTFSSCHHVAAQRKAKMDKSTIGQKPQVERAKGSEYQNQGGQNPQKWENILRVQQSRCTIPWSHDTGVDNQHSRHAITWSHREKQKWTKPPKMRKYFKTPTIKVYDPMITWYRCGESTFLSAPQYKSPKGSESRRTKPRKMTKFFKTETIKVYDPMITWYRCGQSTFSSCHHVAAQRKAKMDKSTTGRKSQRIRIKADKTPKNEKIF